MRANTNILTANTRDSVDLKASEYQSLVAAHTGGDWAQHTQVQFYPSQAFAEPVSGHTVENAFLLRIQLTGTNADGTGDGAFTLPAVYTATATTAGGAPIIIQQPVDITAYTGQVVRFTVVAISAVPITYRWQKAAVDIAGATAASYVISSVTAAHAGAYMVLLTNSYGITYSATATLTVVARPTSVDAFFEGDSSGLFGELFQYTPEGQIFG